MSRSLMIQFQYRNNKTNSIGMHNPSGNTFRAEDYRHLRDMYDTHIVSLLKQDKFKDKVRVVEHVDGKKIYDKMVDTSSASRFIKDITNDRRIK